LSNLWAKNIHRNLNRKTLNDRKNVRLLNQLLDINRIKIIIYLNTAHYRPLRIALKDYQKKLARDELTKLCKRANPMEWNRYALASIAIKIYRHREPFYLYSFINQTFYTTRRKPLMGRFFDNSRGKIGKQKICKRLKFMDDLELDWFNRDWTPDLLRRTLKKAFFRYFDDNA